MKDHPAAAVYTESLFETAKKRKIVDQVGQELNSFAELLETIPEFRVFLSSPSIDLTTKSLLIESLFQSKCSETFFNFLSLIVHRGRFLLFDSMVFQYVELMNKYLKKLRVQCTSAMPLNQETEKLLKAALSKAYSGQEIILTSKIDPHLLGGFVLEVDGYVIDASLQRKLLGFRKRLANRTTSILKS